MYTCFSACLPLPLSLPFSHVHLNLMSYDIRSDSQCSIRGRKVKQRYGSRCLRLEIPGYLSSSQHRERRVSRLFFQVHHACLAHKPRDLISTREEELQVKVPGQFIPSLIHSLNHSLTRSAIQYIRLSSCLLACRFADLLGMGASHLQSSSRQPLSNGS